MNGNGKGHEIISIWHSYNRSSGQTQTCDVDAIPTEHILIYPKEEVTEDSSQTIFNQFNLDFDRQEIFLNNKRCLDRYSFLKFVMPHLSNPGQLSQTLLLCQQTIFAYILKDLHEFFKENSLEYLMVDGGFPVKISINTTPTVGTAGKQDLTLRIQKNMLIVDSVDNDLIMNWVDMDIISESQSDKMIYVYINFKFKPK